MKIWILWSGLAALAVSGSIRADAGIQEWLSRGLEALSPGKQAVLAGLGQEEIAAGLKEALAKGIGTAISRLGREGGFLGNLDVRIPMPAKLATVEKTLRRLGQTRLADEFVATLNQAAERAVPEAATILAEVLGRMPLDDARSILGGPPDAATRYFRRQTEAKLTERFTPIVQRATAQAGVTATYKKLMARAGPWAGMLGLAPDELDAYVTAKALDGLFRMMAGEEKNIRENPLARTSDLLRKVFGTPRP